MAGERHDNLTDGAADNKTRLLGNGGGIARGKRELCETMLFRDENFQDADGIEGGSE